MTEQELADVAKKVARAELVKRTLIVATTAIVSVVLFLQYLTLDNTAATTKAIRATQTTGSPLLLAIQDAIDAAVATNDRIADCLDPEGTCYRESQQRQAVNYYAMVCLDRDGEMDFPELRVCVAQLFAEFGETTPDRQSGPSSTPTPTP